MGTFRKRVRIARPGDGTRSLEVEMVVDSGATYTQIPSHLLAELGIAREHKRKLRLASGEVIERDAGEVRATIGEETLTTPVIFGEGASEALLGAVTLEEFGLAIDPVNKLLVPVPELMLSARHAPDSPYSSRRTPASPSTAASGPKTARGLG